MNSKCNSHPKIQEASRIAEKLGVFRAGEFVEAGYSREYLRRLCDQGNIRRLRRGLYASRSFDGDQNQSLVEASTRFPRGVVCLMSALQFHEIGTQSPAEVWLAIPAGTNQPRTTEDLPIRFCKFSKATHAFRAQPYMLRGGRVHIYTPAKTVADCFKYRNKFGIDVAVEAMKDGWRQQKFTLTELREAAEVCRVAKVIQPYLEMLVA